MRRTVQGGTGVRALRLELNAALADIVGVRFLVLDAHEFKREAFRKLIVDNVESGKLCWGMGGGRGKRPDHDVLRVLSAELGSAWAVPRQAEEQTLLVEGFPVAADRFEKG